MVRRDAGEGDQGTAEGGGSDGGAALAEEVAGPSGEGGEEGAPVTAPILYLATVLLHSIGYLAALLGAGWVVVRCLQWARGARRP